MARLIFRHFWGFIALVAAVSQWFLWWWFARPVAGPATHVTVLLALLAVDRVAAVALERERHRHPLARAVGMATLAVGFGAFVVAGSVGLMALAWTATSGLMALPAVASGLAPALPLADPGLRILTTAGALVATASVGYGYWRGHRAIEVERRTLVLPTLPPGLDGLRVVHLSDLHVGPLADRAALADAIERVSALDPDLICVTGDLVDSAKADLAAWTPLLATLHARHGVFAILGNHDRDAGFERVAAAVAAGTAWHVLRDRVATLTFGGAHLHLVGLEDRRSPARTARLPALLAELPAGEFRILLAHHPDAFDDAAAAAIPLTLAGHTHGGQLAVPRFRHLNVARLMISRRSVGWYRQDGQYLHVSAGLGVSGQRIRVGVPRAITEITLVRPPERADRQ